MFNICMEEYAAKLLEIKCKKTGPSQTFYRGLLFGCSQQSFKRLFHPPIHPSTHLFMIFYEKTSKIITFLSCSNMSYATQQNNNVFWEKEKKNIGNYMTLLIILWYDYFGENHTPLQRNGIAAIPKIYWNKMLLTNQWRSFLNCFFFAFFTEIKLILF